MNNVISLSEEIWHLRKHFHLRLANKRGLLVRESDVIGMGWMTDDNIQSRLEKISILRRPSFWKKVWIGWKLIAVRIKKRAKKTEMNNDEKYG